MKQSVRPFHRTILAFAFAATLFSAGCGGKKPRAVDHTPPPPPPAAAKPTVTFSANPASINKGESSTLTWTTTDATNVSISPEVGAVTAQGSTKVSPSDSVTYTITASGPGGSADASARVTLSQPPPPETKTQAPGADEMFLKEVHDAYFDLDKADIRADAREALGKTAEFLRNYPQVKVNIEGHCDERGSTEYNLALGDRRASAVKQYLVSLGISADRMSTVSYGKEKPVCMEASEDCYQRNRRGHFVKSN